jgi:hypothetical protein
VSVIAPAVRRVLELRWRAYRSWNRACLLNAWRATRSHFGSGRRAALEVSAPALVTMLALYRWGGAEPHLDIAAAIAAGAAAGLLWILIVLCWNFALAPYRLWLAARTRITHLQLAIGRRIDRQVIEQELELRIREGMALMDTGSPSQSQLTQWYERVLRAVSRVGDRERILLENSGPAPGSRGGALEMLILSNRIEKIRLLLDRQPGRAARMRRAAMPARVPPPMRDRRPTPVRVFHR